MTVTTMRTPTPEAVTVTTPISRGGTPVDPAVVIITPTDSEHKPDPECKVTITNSSTIVDDGFNESSDHDVSPELSHVSVVSVGDTAEINISNVNITDYDHSSSEKGNYNYS